LSTIAQNLDRNKFRLTLVTQDDGPLAKIFRAAGQRVVILKLPAWRRARNILVRYFAVWRLKQLLADTPADIIHCNSYRLVPYALWLRRIRKAPVIAHLHDLLKAKHVRGFRVGAADRVLTVSNHIQSPLLKFRKKVRTVYNGITVEKFSAASAGEIRREFFIPASARVIGLIANFTENKRHDLFVCLAAAINKIDPRFYFMVVGHNVWNSPVTQASLEQRVKNEGLADRVIFTGWRDDVPSILKNLDAVVVPSDFESLSLVVLEGMAAGCLAFAQKTSGGPAESISDGQDGFLVDFADSAATAGKMIAVLNDPALCQKIKAQAREKVRRDFAVNVFIKRIENVYGELSEAGGKE